MDGYNDDTPPPPPKKPRLSRSFKAKLKRGRKTEPEAVDSRRKIASAEAPQPRRTWSDYYDWSTVRREEVEAGILSLFEGGSSRVLAREGHFPLNDTHLDIYPPPFFGKKGKYGQKIGPSTVPKKLYKDLRPLSLDELLMYAGMTKQQYGAFVRAVWRVLAEHGWCFLPEIGHLYVDLATRMTKSIKDRVGSGCYTPEAAARQWGWRRRLKFERDRDRAYYRLMPEVYGLYDDRFPKSFGAAEQWPWAEQIRALGNIQKPPAEGEDPLAAVRAARLREEGADK